MTTKHLTSPVEGGYTLSAAYTALYAYSQITGAPGASLLAQDGGPGGVGLTSAHGAAVRNFGVIFGGVGGVGGAGQSSASSGVGGFAGYTGGVGGVGVSLTGGSILNAQQILGGAGGQGGQGGSGGAGANGGAGGAGGKGGAGVTLAGANLTNFYFIGGGAGGAGGAGGTPGSGGAAGVGGAGGYSGNGVQVTGGGTIFNGSTVHTGATIQGYSGIVDAGGGVLSVINFGTVAGQGDGVDLRAGDSLVNEAGAMISGAYYAVFELYPATIVNYGTLRASATGSQGVGSFGGVLVNGGAGNSTALIEGGIGVDDLSAVGITVTNFATIKGTTNSVVFSAATDRLIAEAGSTFIGAVVGGGGALELANGTGTITGLGGAGTISGDIAMTFSGFASYRLDKGASFTLDGAETLAAGQTLTNAGTATVTGPLTVSGSLINTGRIDGSAATDGGAITNQGTINNGVGMNGGRVTNGSATNTLALISAARYGIYGNALAPATVTNFGTIQGGDASATYVGVWLNDGGRIVNGGATDAKALITGAKGVFVNGPTSTVTNFGTIRGTGGLAVVFGYSTDRLIDEAGSVLTGVAQGGGGTLELAKGSGTISGLGKAYVGFGAYTVDTGGAWAFTGTNVIAHKLGGAGAVSLIGGATTVAAGGALTVAKVTESGAATTAVFAADATFAGVWTQTAGTLAVTAGHTLTFTGTSDSFAGTLSGGGAVTIAAGGAATLNAGANLSVVSLGLSQIGSRLTLATSLSYGGTFTEGAATILALGANSLTLTKAATLSGSVTGPGGSLIFTGGAETLAAGVSLVMSNWTIGGGAAVTIAGSLAYAHAFTQNASKITVATGKTLTIEAGGVFTGATIDGGALTTAGAVSLKGLTLGHVAWLNNGTATQTATTVLGNTTVGASVLTNASVFDITTDTGITISGGGGSIVNQGLFEKTAGAKTSVIAPAVANVAGATILVGSGVLEFKAGVTGGGKAAIGGGVLRFDAAFSQAVAFTGASGVLDLALSHDFHGQVSGFSTTGGTAFELRDITFTAGTTKASFAGTTASGILTVTDGTHIARINLVGDYTHATWALSGIFGGGTKVVDPPAGGGGAPMFAQTLAALGAAHGLAGLAPPPAAPVLPTLAPPAPHLTP